MDRDTPLKQTIDNNANETVSQKLLNQNMWSRGHIVHKHTAVRELPWQVEIWARRKQSFPFTVCLFAKQS